MKAKHSSFLFTKKALFTGMILLGTYQLHGALRVTSEVTSHTLTTQTSPVTQTQFSINVRNSTLEEFAKEVERVTGYSFIYGEEVRINGRITLSIQNRSLSYLLQKAFENQPVGFEISGKHILLHKRRQPQKTVSRKFTISGYVTDGASSETLIGANVLDKRQQTGTATNPFGFYTLTLPEGEVELSFSYLGYETRQSSFLLAKDTTMNIRLSNNNQLAEVVVVSAKKEAGVRSTAMGSHEIPMAQIQHTPAILGEADVLKTIQLMPGVQAGVEGFSGLYVRGGGPDQNLVLLDGIPVYNADHMFGIFSIFTPEAVKKVTLFKSSFPARYGGRLSSIVDVRTNDGDQKDYHGTLSVGSLTSKLHIEGPIAKERTSFSLSARTTHTLPFEGLFKGKEESFNYYFYDLNAKVSHRINHRNRVFLSLYQGRDQYKYQLKGTTSYFNDNTVSSQNKHYDSNHINWGNTIIAGRWNHIFNSKLFGNTTVAYNSYRMLINGKINEERRQKNQLYTFQYESSYRSGIEDWSFQTDFDYTPNPMNDIRFGIKYTRHRFSPETINSKIKEKENGTVSQDTLYRGNSGGYMTGHESTLYLEDKFDIGERLSLNAGIHFSLFHTQGKNYYSAQPRISAHYKFNDDFSVKSAYSQMTQYVHLLSSTSISMPTDLWVPITKNIRPMHSHQYSSGIYYTGIPGWELSLEGYYKQMQNVLEYQDGVSFLGNSTNWEKKVEMGTGRSMGLEFMAQKNIGKSTGWIAYTLAKSDRQFKDGSISNGKRFPYKYDRRHNISICLNHRFSDRIDLGATWIYNTGGTITIPQKQTAILKPDGSIEEAGYISNRNNYRLPASHRLNIGINFHKKKKHGIRTWNISLYNAYNAMNPTIVYAERKHEYAGFYPDGNGGIQNSPQYVKTVIKKLTLLPCIPSVTYTYKF